MPFQLAWNRKIKNMLIQKFNQLKLSKNHNVSRSSQNKSQSNQQSFLNQSVSRQPNICNDQYRFRYRPADNNQSSNIGKTNK